jgi:hypothetical protein
MNKFNNLYNSILNEVKASPTGFSGTPVKPVGKYANTPLDIKPGYDAMQNTINQKLAAKTEKQYDKSQNSPYTRGEFDSYNRHPKQPHYYIKVEGGNRRVEEKDMTPEEIEAYHAGFEANEKARDWREY